MCTGNSARSQIAEALLAHKGHGRFIAASAGSEPAARDAVRYLAVRIDLMLALPFEQLQRQALKVRLENLGADTAPAE